MKLSTEIKQILISLAIDGKLDGDITQLDESVFDEAAKKKVKNAFFSGARRLGGKEFKDSTIEEQFEEYYSNTYSN